VSSTQCKLDPPLPTRRDLLHQVMQVADAGDRYLVAWGNRVGRAQQAVTGPIGRAGQTAVHTTRGLAAKLLGSRTAPATPKKDRDPIKTVPRLPVLLQALEQVIAEHKTDGPQAIRSDERFWRILHLLQVQRRWANDPETRGSSSDGTASDEPPSDLGRPVLLSARPSPATGR
jgi:hypothetical protein